MLLVDKCLGHFYDLWTKFEYKEKSLMKLKVFSIYDSASESYSPPFCTRATGIALRDFIDECSNPQSRISKNPEHFHLFELGEYDDGSGTFDMYSAHRCIAKAIEHVKPKAS